MTAKPAPLATNFLDRIRQQKAQPAPPPAPAAPVAQTAAPAEAKPIQDNQAVAPPVAAPGKRKRGPRPQGERASGNRPDRAGTVLIAGHFPPEVRKKLHMIALQDDKSLQEVMAEAFSLLFAKKAISQPVQ